jgi:hypothetical protein
VDIAIISAGNYSMYNKYANTQVMKDRSEFINFFKSNEILNCRLAKNIKVLLEEMMGKPYPNFKKYIELEVSGQTLGDNVFVVTPSIRYLY